MQQTGTLIATLALHGVCLTGAHASDLGPPTHDTCDGAFDMEIDGIAQLGTNAGATDDAISCGPNGEAGVWYTFIGNGGLVELTTCNPGTNFDTVLSVYSGPCNDLVCEGANDDACGDSLLQSAVQLCTEAGARYYVLIEGWLGATGDYQLTAVSIGPPAFNDQPCDAVLVQLGSPFEFNNTCATADPGEVTPGVGTGSSSCDSNDGWCAGDPNVQNSLWFFFQAPDCGGVNLSTGLGDHQLAVYSFVDCNDYSTFEEIGANDDGGAFLDPVLTLCDLTPGQYYMVQVDGYLGHAGPGVMSIVEDVCTDCNSNGIDDDCEEGLTCENAEPWPLFQFSSRNNIDTCYGAPTCSSITPHPGRWFSIEGNGSLYSATMCNTTNPLPFDTLMAVYKGTCDSLECIGLNDDACGVQSRVDFCTEPGVTYYIHVSGLAGDEGTFFFGIRDLGPFGDGGSDCNDNGIPDSCDIENGTSIDCNNNGIPDECDLASGASYDCNCNGVPDECDVMNPAMDTNGDGYVDSCTACPGDVNCDGIVNGLDIMEVFYNLGSPGPYADVNQDGIVSIFDYYIIIWNYGAICGNCAG